MIGLKVEQIEGDGDRERESTRFEKGETRILYIYYCVNDIVGTVRPNPLFSFYIKETFA